MQSPHSGPVLNSRSPTPTGLTACTSPLAPDPPSARPVTQCLRLRFPLARADHADPTDPHGRSAICHPAVYRVGSLEQKIIATEDLPTSTDVILSASFDKDGAEAPSVATGILSLYSGKKKVG